MSAQRFPQAGKQAGWCSHETSGCVRALAARNGGLPCSVLCVVNASAASARGKARRATCIAASSALRRKRSNRRWQCIHKQIWPKAPVVAEPACKQERSRPDLGAPHALLPCGASILAKHICRRASVAVRKFARVLSLHRSELPNQSDTSKLMILVSLWTRSSQKGLPSNPPSRSRATADSSPP